MKLQRFSGNPILSPNPANPWENLVTCNPGPWENLVTCNPGVILDDGMFYMLYRAAGDDEKHVIRFGLATSTDGFHFNRVSAEPVFGPSEDGPDSGCVEDPRIVKFGDTFYITYAYRPMAPGRYWTFPHDVILKPDTDEYAPLAWKENLQYRPGLHPRLPHLPAPGPPDFARPGRPGRDPVPRKDRRPVCDAASA